MSVIRGYRLGRWDIPALLDEKKTVEEKVVWINNFNDSEKKIHGVELEKLPSSGKNKSNGLRG